MVAETFVSRFGGLMVRLQPGRYGKYELRAEVTVRFDGGRFTADPAVAAALKEHYLYGKEFWAESDLQKKAQKAVAAAAGASQKPPQEESEAEDFAARVQQLYERLVAEGVDPSELQTATGEVSPAKVVKKAQSLGIS
jgi:arginine/lysine/ornithine decarboxylase